MSEGVMLSFCIATYNRADRVNQLVRSLLSCNNRNMEVVVVDNCSTDSTVKILREIEDDRLKLFINSENKGAIYNFVKSIEYGTGKYLFQVVDRDLIDIHLIADFIEELKKVPEFAMAHCYFYKKNKPLITLYKQGEEALLRFGYKPIHPTGVIFSRKYFSRLKDIQMYRDADIVGLYPQSFIYAELAMLGDAVEINYPIWDYSDPEYVLKNKSNFQDKLKAKKYLYEPEERLEQFKKSVLHILNSNYDKLLMKKIIKEIFKNMLNLATIVYKLASEDPEKYKHYNVPYKKVTDIDMIKIAFKINKLSKDFIKNNVKDNIHKITKSFDLITVIIIIKNLCNWLKIKKIISKFQ